MNIREWKMISPSVLKAFSVATSATAFKATSERCGVSSKETEESEWHRAVSACERRVRLKMHLCCYVLRVCRPKICMCWQSKFFSNVFIIWNRRPSRNQLTKTQLSDRVGMSLITISLSEGQLVEMYLNPFTVIWGEREEHVCVYGWNLTHPPGCTFVCFSLFQGCISEAIQLDPNQRQFLRGRCILCCGASVHMVSGWAGVGCCKLNPPVGSAAPFNFSSPSAPCSFAPSADSHQGTVGNKRRHVQTSRTD